MIMVRTDKPNQRYLVCIAWREGRACSNEWIRYPEIEDVFLSDVRFLVQRCPQPVMHVEARRVMLKRIKNRLAYLKDRLARERAVHDALAEASRIGRAWPQSTQAEIDSLLAERYRLREDRNYWEDATLKVKLEALRSAVETEPRDLGAVNERLRTLLVKVVVDWENEQLILHWRHGGRSYAGFWRRRQKGGHRNPTSNSPQQTWPKLPPPNLRESE